MKNYKYTGMSSNGGRIEGVIEAFDEKEAVLKAKQNCHVVLEVKQVSAQGTNIFNSDLSVLLGAKIKDKELSLLCSQLSIELKAGLPLVRALSLVADNEKNPVLKKILTEVSDDVKAGHGLADSFEERGPQLPNSFIATIRAGEESGKLDDSFSRLKVYYENQSGIKSKVGSALIYPAILLVVAIAVVVIMLIFAVPVFTQSFADLGTELPGVTKFLIAMSDFFIQKWLLLLAIVAAIFLAYKLIGKTEKGAHVYALIALKFPGIGDVNIMSATTNFCSTMSTMLASGLPLAEAIKITADILDNLLLKEDMMETQRGILEGKKMTDGLINSKWFPKLMVEMTAVGEETGNLEETLDVVNDFYRKEVDVAVQRALGILEPAITMFLAGIVMFLLLSIYLPLFSMYGSI